MKSITGRAARVLGWTMLAAMLGGLPSAGRAQEVSPAAGTGTTNRQFMVQAIGRVERRGDRAALVLAKRFQPGLVGLEQFSHVWVFWWFDRNDSPRQRAILQVHPRGDRARPLTGVFATRSPVRPNLIGLSLCKIRAVQENVVEVESIDALDGTPVLDLKPYAPALDSAHASGPGESRSRLQGAGAPLRFTPERRRGARRSQGRPPPTGRTTNRPARLNPAGTDALTGGPSCGRKRMVTLFICEPVEGP